MGGFTRIVAEGHGLSDCFFTRSVAESHGFFFLSRIVGFFFFFFFTRRVAEVTNYRIIEFSSHGVSRKVTGVLLFSDYRIIELFLHTLDNVYILGFSDVCKALRDKRLRSCRQPVFQNGDGRTGVCLSATKKTHGTKKIMLWECSFVSPALHHIMMVISLFQYKGIKIF